MRTPHDERTTLSLPANPFDRSAEPGRYRAYEHGLLDGARNAPRRTATTPIYQAAYDEAYAAARADRSVASAPTLADALDSFEAALAAGVPVADLLAAQDRRASVVAGDVACYYAPSGRGQRTHTAPHVVTVREGAVVTVERFDDRETAMERAAALAGVKL